MAAIDGDSKTGFGIVGRAKAPLLILRFAQPLHTSAASTLTVRVHQDSESRQATIGRFRIGLSSGTYSWDNNPRPKAERAQNQAEPAAIAGLPRSLSKALEQPEEKRSAEQTALIRDTFESSSPQLFAARLAIAKLETEQSFLEGAVADVMITESAAAARNAHPSTRELDGRFGRRGSAGDTGISGPCRQPGRPRRRAWIWRTGWSLPTIR